MALGIGVLLFVLGLIISFALEVDIPGLGDSGLGFIFMGVGILCIVLSFAKTHMATSRKTVVSRDQDSTGSFVEERRTH